MTSDERAGSAGIALPWVYRLNIEWLRARRVAGPTRRSLMILPGRQAFALGRRFLPTSLLCAGLVRGRGHP